MTTDQNDDSRKQGVELGPLADDLEDEEYPLELGALLERYGDREVGLGDDTSTLRTVLGPQDEATYDSADDVRQSIVGMVGDEAIGRKNYTDRGGNTEAEEGDEESM
ncbi:hypothetical protein U4E84_06050 [Halorubrum sp. AD140]|uniref:DUF5789 family protein n=1 Tax=Halorubrum sp. AD140 TaxID=3050073 RepID=UPI002ACCA297|nr:hypothetical protein [Halorubrum sp. AD140]MDZ5810904.1 hypothetical protein [Halorubrum sp. AD140]